MNMRRWNGVKGGFDFFFEYRGKNDELKGKNYEKNFSVGGGLRFCHFLLSLEYYFLKTQINGCVLG